MLGRAKLGLDSAARAGDVAFAVRLLAPDAEVVTEDGQILRGAEGAASATAWLDRRGSGLRISVVQLMPERVALCTDGVIERDGHYLVAYAGGASVAGARADTLRGRYAARWTLQDDGSLRVRRLALAANGADAPRPEPCRSLRLANASASAAAQRVSLWLLPPAAVGLVRSDTRAAIEDRLQDAGYGDGDLRLIGHGGSRGASTTRVGALGARVRIWGPLGVEASTTLQPIVERVQRNNIPKQSYVTVDQEARVLTGLVSYERRQFRLGAGPYLVRNDWRLTDERFEGRYYWGFEQDERWQSNDLGLALDGQFTQPVFQWLSLKVIAQYRGLGTTQIPATRGSPAMRVSTGGTMLGLALGTGL